VSHLASLPYRSRLTELVFVVLGLNLLLFSFARVSFSVTVTSVPFIMNNVMVRVSIPGLMVGSMKACLTMMSDMELVPFLGPVVPFIPVILIKDNGLEPGPMILAMAIPTWENGTVANIMDTVPLPMTMVVSIVVNGIKDNVMEGV
jgi:hypothetical protein